MNIVSWNVRGLGRPAKRFLVKDFLSLHHAEVCCLQESKLADLSLTTWREVGGSYLDQFVFAPAEGLAGGMIIGWNSATLAGTIEKVGAFSLTIKFLDKRDNFSWRCTTVYGPNARALKPHFGRSFVAVVVTRGYPGCCVGILTPRFPLRISPLGVLIFTTSVTRIGS